MTGDRRVELEPDVIARVAAALAVHEKRHRAEVLAPFELSEAEWDKVFAEWTRRLARELREGAGSSAPIEERYPLAVAYAKAYSEAVADERAKLAAAIGDAGAPRPPRDERDEDRTVRLPPSSPSDALGVLAVSNRAARAR